MIITTIQRIPLLGITAYSGTGKTTLLKQLIPALSNMDIRCALIKHSHHNMDIDIPGKDSYELRKAGASQTIVACDQRWALMTETPDRAISLTELADKFDVNQIDLVLVEGFKHEPINKIALFRRSVGKPLDGLIDNHVIALATDEEISVNVPLLDINNLEQIADFIQSWLNNKNIIVN
ncbi:molybdopterin-guanine dinucleotide biosynthesis protein MobB [Jinshanibacter sp. LJY008]|uniref:Molybdopterin-guanine dinucleotide biosynthesis protein MobB n=1 Tax=Limnobaculum eriocheiris TaxID=2897391 RepID=A0A9X1MVE4_9GAMM|nr:molybdopterin-guanine dinucleotide biosynthesis protein MobB [Limnobaculum eriocheiris]MCD1125664.1 molybdopterin-guanine dinucleotide biosynthesis protein MobB [Limnobaculum eriocheiris]